MTTCNDSGRIVTGKFADLRFRVLFGLLLCCAAGVTHAASIYKCVDAHGHTSFRDTPCAVHAHQTKLDVAGLPLIDHGQPRWAAPAHASGSHEERKQSRRARATARRRKSRPVMSWECRAADGEVFYRHQRCPSSVPGDGTVRVDYADRVSREYPRGRHNAWSRVRVRGTKVPRAEACRRIHSASAAGRDGHLRDETVSTYDHLMGRDPCSRA